MTTKIIRDLMDGLPIGLEWPEISLGNEGLMKELNARYVARVRTHCFPRIGVVHGSKNER